MPVPWNKRKDRVKLWEQKNKEEGRLPYWNDRARWLNTRARKEYGFNTTITGRELNALYNLSDKRCYFCKEYLTPSQAHFDHMTPLKNGGIHDISNLCIACCECNTSKGDDSIDDFLKRVFDTQTPERIYENRFTVRG